MRIAIIGGGAAGMMCGATILEKNPDADIFLFEKNSTLGRKVIISGGGRCNVTTGVTNRRKLLSNYTRGAEFLNYAFTKFSPVHVQNWFIDHGVPLKCEDDNRVFPVSDEGKDIVSVFENIFLKHNVHLRCGESVMEITAGISHRFHIRSHKAEYDVDIVIITTGGNAYQQTGSTGDGYAFARAFGHTITQLGPSLNSFEVAQEWCTDLRGVSLPNAQLVVDVGGLQKSVDGPMIFTHFGISGPSVFALSSNIAFETISKKNPISVSLIPLAHRTYEDWDRYIQHAIHQNGLQHMLTVVSNDMPKRLAQAILEIASIPLDKKCAVLSKEERKKLAKLLSIDLKLTLLSRRPGDEFVTAGGVKLLEVNEKTMESRLYKGLFFAGEVLDIDGLTGGFNLQSSWATGRIAGLSV